MATRAIQILAVCPYAGLDNIIRKVAADYPQFEITYEDGELSKGVEIARQYAQGQVDAIISRGGTARMIASAFKIPTVDIGITTNDLISALSLMRNAPGQKFCLVGFYEVTSIARYLDRLLDRPLPVFVTATAEENIALMKRLREDGYELVIGDATSVRFAKAEGLNQLMITSGEDAVRQCLNQVSRLFSMQEDNHEILALQRNLLKNLDVSFFLINSSFTVIHSQCVSDDLRDLSSSVMQQISVSAVKRFLNGEIPDRTTFERDDLTWQITLRPDILRGENVTLVRWEKLNRLYLKSRSLLKDISHATYPFQVESLRARDPKMIEALSDCRAFAQRQSPVLIVGEPFSGRQALAHMLYNLSSFGKGGIYSLNALKFTEDNLCSLFESRGSFLTSLSLTLVVRNLQRAAPELTTLFLNYVLKSGFTRHSRLICLFDSAVDPRNEEAVTLTRFLLSTLESLLITVPALRERKGDLLFLATLALGDSCSVYGKSCGGFTPAAQEIILNHPWSGNLHELRGIIRETTAALDHEYIDAPDLEHALSKWQTLYRSQDACNPANGPYTLPAHDFLKGTLEEIENRILLAVLEEENGHKSRVTQRLGISRNTLWRKLKELGVN